MTQAELDRAVAKATGETMATIQGRGFGPLTEYPEDHVEREPLVVDWDEVQAQRLAVLP